jgi:hypothetical protein
MKIFLYAMILPLAASAAEPASYKAVSSTSAGQGNFSEGVSLLGDHPVTETGSVDWSAGYTYSRTPVGADSNRTSAADLTVGYRGSWDVGGGLDLSGTPAENLTSFGPQGWVGYVFTWGNEARRSIEPKLTYHGDTYKQTFAATSVTRAGSRRAVARPSAGSQSIHQNEWNLAVDVNPFDILGFRVSASSYKYNRDVNAFLATLDTPRAVSTGASSFSTTLGGFPKNSVEVGVTLYPFDTWDLILDITRTKVQADNSTSTASKVEVEKEFSKAFKLGLGFDHETSAQLGEENLTLLDLTFEF